MEKCQARQCLARQCLACTETFVEIGGWETEEEASACLQYIKTKFFRALVGIIKQTQDASNKVYKYVPIQDFTRNSDIDWSKSVEEIEKQLYEKYNLSEEDIEFIKQNVESMDDNVSVEDSIEEVEE